MCSDHGSLDEDGVPQPSLPLTSCTYSEVLQSLINASPGRGAPPLSFLGLGDAASSQDVLRMER